MRAPLFKGKRNEFVKVLVDFIKAEKFKETICLTSSHAFERLDSQIEGEHSLFVHKLLYDYLDSYFFFKQRQSMQIFDFVNRPEQCSQCVVEREIGLETFGKENKP